jgi:cell wall-associated NlpC family hydrolase
VDVVAEATALATVLEATRLASGSPRSPHLGFAAAPSRAAALIVERAVQLVGVKQLGRVDRGVPDDCSGFVRLAYQKAGIDLVNHGFLAGENAVTAILPPRRGPGRRPPAPPAPGGPRLLPRDV